MKELDIIPLAKRKMARRGIPKAWVAEALRNADQIVAGRGDRWLRNSGAESVDKFVVITAYLTSDIKRYWKEKSS